MTSPQNVDVDIKKEEVPEEVAREIEQAQSIQRYLTDTKNQKSHSSPHEDISDFEKEPSYIDYIGAQAINVDNRISSKVVALWFFILVIIAIANYLLYTYLEYDARAFIILVLLFNTMLIHSASSYVVSWILFPFANYFMKLNYHINLNRSMINEINRNFQKGNEII